MQLCAQAMCLEEMTGSGIPFGGMEIILINILNRFIVFAPLTRILHGHVKKAPALSGGFLVFWLFLCSLPNLCKG